jgi:hypothetical protein
MIPGSAPHCSIRHLLLGEGSLRKAIHEFSQHYHYELGNRLIMPEQPGAGINGAIQCRPQLGGMLNYYYRQAA